MIFGGDARNINNAILKKTVPNSYLIVTKKNYC